MNTNHFNKIFSSYIISFHIQKAQENKTADLFSVHDADE